MSQYPDIDEGRLVAFSGRIENPEEMDLAGGDSNEAQPDQRPRRLGLLGMAAVALLLLVILAATAFALWSVGVVVARDVFPAPSAGSAR